MLIDLELERAVGVAVGDFTAQRLDEDQHQRGRPEMVRRIQPAVFASSLQRSS